MSYWLFGSESPLSTRPSRSIAEARVRAVNFLKKRNDKEYVNIVKADEEPYYWRMNYDYIGKVSEVRGDWVFKPKNGDERNFNPKTGALLQGVPSDLAESVRKYDPKNYNTLYMYISKRVVKVKDFKQALKMASASIQPSERNVRNTFYISNVNGGTELWVLHIYWDRYYFISRDIRSYYDMNGTRYVPPKNMSPWLPMETSDRK